MRGVASCSFTPPSRLDMHTTDTSSSLNTTTHLGNQISLILLWLLLSSIVFPSVISASSIALVFCISTFNYWTRGFKSLWQTTRSLWPGMLIFIVIGVVLSELPVKSAKGAYDMLRCMALFYFITPFLQKIPEEQLLRSLKYFLIPAVTVYWLTVLGIQFHEHLFFIRDSLIAHQIFGSHHHFVSSVVIATILSACLFINYKIDRRYKLYVLLLLFYCLVSSNSRGNTLALAFVGLFLLIYKTSSTKLALLCWSLSFSVLVTIYAYVFYLMPCPEGDCNITVYNRQHIYHQTLRFITDDPLWGQGFSVFKLISGVLEGGNKVPMPHNLMLESLYSVGIVGTLALLMSLALWFRQSGWTVKQLLQTSSLPFQTQLGLCLLMYLLVRGLFDLKLADSPSFGLLAMAMGFLYARSPGLITHTKPAADKIQH